MFYAIFLMNIAVPTIMHKDSDYNAQRQGEAMEIKKGNVIFEDIMGIDLNGETVSCTDISGTKIYIPMEVVVRLYEGCRHIKRKNGYDWDEYCDKLLSKGGLP
jgi:predicted RNA-binding protein